jgi:hypothetical protein
MSEIKGSVGGLTYSSPTGARIRMNAKTSPALKRSNHSQRLKCAWGGLSSRWGSFTTAQKERWQRLALNYPGSKGKPSPTDIDAGRRLFMSSLAIDIATGQILTSVTNDALCPPTDFERYKLVRYAITSQTPTTSVVTFYNAVSQTAILQRWRMGPLDPTVVKRPHGFDSKNLVSFAAGAAASFAVTLTGLVAGRRYFYRFRLTYKSSTFYCPAGTFYLEFTQP